MKLSELYWYRITPLHFILWPLSILYGCFLSIKKLCYWLEILPSVKLPVPVIVVDSLSVADHNKPPLLLWIVDTLLSHGYTPGIITCGNSDHSGSPRAVTVSNDPYDVDSKTSLLAQHCGKSCPVWIGGNRIAVARALLNAHPTCNVIICTDGLPYFRLERDIEIVIVDFNSQSYGNGLLLPAGPLRLGLQHLAKASIIITSAKPNRQNNLDWQGNIYNMKLINETAYNVLNSTLQQPIADFKNKKLHAIADDENTQWFFDLVHKSGLSAQLHDYREHHLFKSNEIEFPEADAVLMPEENALQCKSFAHAKLWAIPRKAWINDELQIILMNKLQKLS